MNINVKFSIFNINIYKSLTPEEEIIIEKYKDKEYEKNKKFMVLTLKNFETKININNEIIDSKVQLGYIYLYDTDYEILQNGNKKDYLNSEFNCIFGTSIKTEIKENKFKLSELLQTSISDNQKKREYTINILFISNSKENSSKMNIIIEEFFLSPNLSSLTRIYQYSIYYLNIYQESQNIIKGQELKDQLGELSVNEIIPKGLFKDVYYRKLSRRQITRELDLLEVNPVIEKNNKNLKKKYY